MSIGVEESSERKLKERMIFTAITDTCHWHSATSVGSTQHGVKRVGPASQWTLTIPHPCHGSVCRVKMRSVRRIAQMWHIRRPVMSQRHELDTSEEWVCLDITGAAWRTSEATLSGTAQSQYQVLGR